MSLSDNQSTVAKKKKIPEFLTENPYDAEPAHAEYPPSSLGNIERCPGFKNRDTESESSLRGQRIHKALEIGDLDTLVEEERPIAQMCQDVIDSVIEGKRPAFPEQDFREIRLHMDLGNDIRTFGTCDRLLVYGAHGDMFDYKSGWREVADAEFNPQGWCYVIGAFQAFPQLDEITFYFLIPNRDEVSEHPFKRSDMPNMQLRLNTVIRRAMEILPAFIPGAAEELIAQLSPQPELCQYCARQTTCPALARFAIAVAAKLRPELKVPRSVVVDPNRPEDIPDLLRLAPLLEKWASNIRQDALRLNLEESVEIPGFKRFERSVPRSISSVLGAWDVIKEKGISLEDFLGACSKVSMPDLEKLISDLAPRGSKAKAKVALEDALRGADVLHDGGSIYYLKEQKL